MRVAMAHYVEEKLNQLACRIADRRDPRDAPARATAGLVRDGLDQQRLTFLQLSREASKRSRVLTRDGRRQLHQQHGLTSKQGAAARAIRTLTGRHGVP